MDLGLGLVGCDLGLMGCGWPRGLWPRPHGVVASLTSLYATVVFFYIFELYGLYFIYEWTLHLSLYLRKHS